MLRYVIVDILFEKEQIQDPESNGSARACEV